MDHIFCRTQMLLGEEGVQKLAKSRVVLAGVGGVGSYAAEALARSGVGHILLIDDDIIASSNLNRQLHALTNTIGQPKARIMSERLRQINPEIQVLVRAVFLLPDNVTDLLLGDWDYIIDAVDTVSAKLALVEEARRRHIPLISCMGTGNKLDPVRLQVADIYQTSGCPLCRVMRKELRRRKIDALQVIYSDEPPIQPKSTASPSEGSLHPKRQTPGSVSFVPGVAGLIAASVVVRKLSGN